MSAAVTFTSLDTEEKQEAALMEMLRSMGFRVEAVGDEEILVPIDSDHPDFAKQARKVYRLRKRLRR